MTRRVVITGMGVVSPVGSGVSRFWESLCAGRSGIGPVTHFRSQQFPVRIGGQVPDEDIACIERKYPRGSGERDRKVPLGLAAAEQALTDAALDRSALASASLHVGVGLETFFLDDVTPVATAPDMGAALAQAVLAEKDSDGPTLQTPLDRLSQLLGGRYVFGGGWFTNCSACAAGAQAIGEALGHVRDGCADVALAGAADSMLNPLGIGGFSLLRVLSLENDNPEGACRPFDATRQGTVLGEGAAFLVLESLEHAKQRGATIYAELRGYGSSMDACSVSDPEPDGQGAVLAMAAALRDAGLDVADVDCVNAHGTGTPKNDLVETTAIKRVLGSRAYDVPVHAVKSMTGHLIGASGAVEAVTAVLTLTRGIVPPTINLRQRDPQCDLDYVAQGARPFAGEVVLSNSFGFGGQNAALVFGRV